MKKPRLSKKAYVIGLDLGGSSVKCVALDEEGTERQRLNIAFDARKAMSWARAVASAVRQVKKKQKTGPSWIGISAPGLAASDGRSIAYMPGRLRGLEGFIWSEYLGMKKPVPVLNDAQAALLGEAWIGAGSGCKDLAMVTLGTGVGGAAMVNGELLRGHIGRAGHLGHTSLDPNGPPDVCGAPGSLEVAMGNCTIKERSKGKFNTTHALIAAHLKGDEFASEVWLTSVKALAAALCSFINILDPQRIIIGGGIARAGAALFEPLEKFLAPMEWRPGGHRCEIVPAQLGEMAGAFGAARNAILQAEASA